MDGRDGPESVGTMDRNTQPILYLRASHNRIVPESAGDLVLQIRPETTLVTVQAPHFLLQVGFCEAARAICAFLDETH
jgi:hypothetical protein